MKCIPQPLSLRQCYSVAGASFAKWWIPICLLSATLMGVELVPKQLAKVEMAALSQTVHHAVDGFQQGDPAQLEALSLELTEALSAFAQKMLIFSLYAAPFLAILGVLLICTSLMAVKNQRKKYSIRRVVAVAGVHLALALIKVLLIFLLPPVGLFVYVKLSFVSLLMLEKNDAPREAIKQSWAMTRGNVGALFGMVLINGTIQLAMIPTIVGLIPATGFTNTARSAAFLLLSPDEPRPA